MIRLAAGFALALLTALALTPLVIRLARRHGMVAQPRSDRWHTTPTALLGGVAIAGALAAGALVSLPWKAPFAGILAVGAGVFGLGLWDDLRELTPRMKLLGQIVAGLATLALGVSFHFHAHPALEAAATLFWLVGIMNGVNIVDNMDGLAAGTATTSALCMSAYAFLGGMPEVGTLAAVLAGAGLGFLFYNFNPARIFMGDCGSLLLGYLLAVGAVLGTWREATGLMLTFLVPLAFLAVPIFDTTLVSFDRRRHGHSVSTGGRDHSSHRLVLLGLSPRATVTILMGVTLAFGGAGVLLTRLSPYAALTLFLGLCGAMLLLGVLLAQVRVYGETRTSETQPAPWKLLSRGKWIPALVGDAVLLTTSYMGAYMLRFNGVVMQGDQACLEQSLPFVVGAKVVAVTISGVYRSDWRKAGRQDLYRLVRGLAAGSVGAVLLLVALFRFEGYSRLLFGIDFLLSLLFLGGARVALRLGRELLP